MCSTTTASVPERILRAVVALMVLGVALESLAQPLLAIPLLVLVGVLVVSVFTGRCFLPMNAACSAPPQHIKDDEQHDNATHKHV